MRKTLIILLALLCVAPVFAAKKTGIEAGLNLGYSSTGMYFYDDFLDESTKLNWSGFAFGVNAKYAIDKGICAYLKADYVATSKYVIPFGDGSKFVRKAKDQDDEIWSGFKCAAGALYDVDLDTKVKGLSFSAGGGIVFSDWKEKCIYPGAEYVDHTATIGLDILAEADYEVADGITAFVGLEPEVTMLSIFSNGSFFHFMFGFSATAGARYAF